MSEANNVNQLLDQIQTELFQLLEVRSPFVIQDKSSFYGNFFSNKLQVVSVIQKGVPLSFYEFLAAHFPFTEADWANYLNVSTKTLQRNSKELNFQFKSIHSEKLIKIAELFYLGLSVFQSTEAFQQWLHLPVYHLENLTPFELIQTAYGQEFVSDELNRIAHGVFA